MYFNFPHLYCEAGIVQIRQWLEHLRNKTTLSKQMIINCQWLQLTAGTSTSFLKDTSTNLPRIPPTRFTWLRKFLHHIDAHIEIEQNIVPPRNCNNDPSIMDLILDQAWTPTQITIINEMRMHLQIFWISDITEMNTLTIHPYYYTFKGDPPSTSKLRWPPH